MRFFKNSCNRGWGGGLGEVGRGGWEAFARNGEGELEMGVGFDFKNCCSLAL